MGASLSASTNASVQQASQALATNISNDSSCNASCSQIQSGDNVTIIGSNVGSVSFDQTCTISATCSLNAAVDTILAACQAAAQAGTAAPSLFPGIQANFATDLSVQQNRANITTQLQDICNSAAVSNQAQTADAVYVQDSTVGTIGFTQVANVASTCYLVNAVKSTSNMGQDTTQKTSTGGTSILLYIVLAVIAISIIALIIKGVRSKSTSTTGKAPGVAAAYSAVPKIAGIPIV